MKKLKLIFSVIAIFVIAIFAVLNYADPVSAKISEPNYCAINVELSGNGSTSATVWAVHIATSVGYNIPQVGSTNQYTRCHGIPSGAYNIYVCTNYPSYGSELNVMDDSDTKIDLVNGFCPHTQD